MKKLGIISGLLACAICMNVSAAVPAHLKRFDAPVQYTTGATVLDQAYFEVAFQKPYLVTVARPYIKDNVLKGGNYHYLLSHQPDGPQEKTPVRYSSDELLSEVKEEDHLAAVVALTWYLYGEAINKDQSFMSGAIVAADPDMRLYNYLQAYAKRAGNTEPLYSIGIKGTFHRLPGGNKYIVFKAPAQGDTNTTIYLQASAADPQDLHAGTAELVRKALRGTALYQEIKDKQGAVMPTKKALGGWLKKVAPLIASGDAEDKRYRRLPLSTVARFGSLLLSSDGSISGPARRKITEQIKKQGVLGMLVQLDKWAEENAATQVFRDDAVLLGNELERAYDHPRKRFGREVILTKQELWTNYYYHLDATDKSHKLPKALYSFGSRLLRAKRAMRAGDMDALRDLVNGRDLQPVMVSLEDLYKEFANLEPQTNEAITKYLGTVVSKAHKRAGQ